MQNSLKARGYGDIPTDGKFDTDKTETYLKDWQGRNGLNKDGVFGFWTWKTMATQPPGRSTSSPPATDVNSEGVSSAAVPPKDAGNLRRGSINTTRKIFQPREPPHETNTIGLDTRTRTKNVGESLPMTWGGGQQVQSNDPEVLESFRGLENGLITVSTGKPAGALNPNAHLETNPINGEFSIAASHQNRTGQNAFQNVVLTNPGRQPVTVTIDANTSTTSRHYSYYPQATRTHQNSQPEGPGDALARAQADEYSPTNPADYKSPPISTDAQDIIHGRVSGVVDGWVGQTTVSPGQKSHRAILDMVVPPHTSANASIKLYNSANSTPPYHLHLETLTVDHNHSDL